VKYPGAYGNDVTLEVVATPGGGGTLMATVKLAGSIVATSTPFTTNQQLSDWLDAGTWIDPDFADGTAPSAVGTVTFTGGTDGNMPCTNLLSMTDALGHLPKELGPGQLSAPGKTDEDMQSALLAAGEATNRVVLLDTDLGDDPNTCMAKAAKMRGQAQDRYGSMWAPWLTIPGVAGGTTRKVPWSPVQAALCSANDRGGNPNQAVAGLWGQVQWGNALDMIFSEVEAELMLYAGVNTARNIYGSIQAYAFRTLVDPDGPRADWRELNHARLNMAITADCNREAQSDVFAQLDGRGHTIAAFGGRMGAVCMTY
ncbi:MAG: hypothetical protein J2P17_16665, partial [Mycobacterium sp.]|nr:hypothetical protein [Mycobacterium sp.]